MDRYEGPHTALTTALHRGLYLETIMDRYEGPPAYFAIIMDPYEGPKLPLL
jgi:hypothetical protein